MEFFCYHRDRPGSMTLRSELLESHWSYMDRFDTAMVARGPTFTGDGILTGSIHILDLPDPATARSFAFDEPGYQAGMYRDVLLRRWHNVLGRTMWDSSSNHADRNRYLVIGFTFEPATGITQHPHLDDLIAFGPLLSDDAESVLGAVALLEAPDAGAARKILPSDQYVGVEVHQWRFGGRPSGR